MENVAFDFLFFSHRVRLGELKNQRRRRIISLTLRASERQYVMTITSPDYKTLNGAPSESCSF
jgi:hypothetical protein